MPIIVVHISSLYINYTFLIFMKIQSLSKEMSYFKRTPIHVKVYQRKFLKKEHMRLLVVVIKMLKNPDTVKGSKYLSHLFLII